jgi:predicted signal transduction protein with EAL and GGDEF domain
MKSIQTFVVVVVMVMMMIADVFCLMYLRSLVDLVPV